MVDWEGASEGVFEGTLFCSDCHKGTRWIMYVTESHTCPPPPPPFQSKAGHTSERLTLPLFLWDILASPETKKNREHTRRSHFSIRWGCMATIHSPLTVSSLALQSLSAWTVCSHSSWEDPSGMWLIFPQVPSRVPGERLACSEKEAQHEVERSWKSAGQRALWGPQDAKALALHSLIFSLSSLIADFCQTSHGHTSWAPSKPSDLSQAF